MSLEVERGAGEIISVILAFGVEMQVPARGHRHLAGLEGKPLAAAYHDLCVVNRIAKDAAGKGNLAR